MQEEERVAAQVFDRDVDDVTRARKPCLRVPYPRFGLQAPHPQPFIGKIKARTAMIVLPIVDADGLAILQHRAVSRHPVGDAREKLGQMERRVGVMANAKEQHLSVALVDTTDGTFRNMGRKRERIEGDRACFRPDRREGMGVIAAKYARHSPKGIRHHAEAWGRRSVLGIERPVVVLRGGRHHHGGLAADRITERRNHAERPSLDRPCCPERGMDEQHATCPDAELPQLIGDSGSAHLDAAIRHSPSRANSSRCSVPSPVGHTFPNPPARAHPSAPRCRRPARPRLW
jgi:hypothetical protein